MTKEPKRISLDRSTDLLGLVEDVKADKEPRLLERNGEDLVVIVSPEDYESMAGKARSKANKAALLALAGVWKDIDTEALIERIYRSRHESPPSAPVEI